MTAPQLAGPVRARILPLPTGVLWLVALGGVALPLVVALVVLGEPQWYPSLEYAQTELHVRDVGTSRTPLTGLVGRLGPSGEGGSHPGPLSFYALAPVYRLAGTSSWSLQVATVGLHLVGAGTALWILHRRGGRRLLLLGAAALAVLTRFYGPSLLTEPWNPYLPLLAWLVFVLAVWSVLDDDLLFLPVAAFAGSLCAQTHISYLGPVAGLGLLGLGGAVRSLWRRESGLWPAGWFVLGAGIVGVAVWGPPVLDELRYRPGNLSLLFDFFRDPPEPPIGLRRGVQLVLANLDPVRLLTGRSRTTTFDEPDHWPVLGSLHLLAWAGSAVWARRNGLRSLVHLDVVLGVALVLAVVVASRINGSPWAWLLLWVWGLAALMVVAMAGTLGGARAAGFPRRALAATVGGVVVVALVSTALATGSATRVEPNATDASRALAALVPATVAALAEDEGAGRQRYLVRWADPAGVVGALQGFGLVDGLDRAGMDVVLERPQRLRAAPHLTAGTDGATMALTLATGSVIDDWDRLRGSRRIAAWDPRTPGERARQERLLETVAARLEDLGLAALRDLLDVSLLGTLLSFDNEPRVPEELGDALREVLELGTPSAVFMGPVDRRP